MNQRNHIDLEDIDLQQIENELYPVFVKDAVRFGYQYRCKAEINTKEEKIQFHYCLAEVSPFLLWFGKMVIAGVAYDVIKRNAIHLWEKLMKMKVVIPDDVNKLLISEDELRRFVTYVDEFNRGQLGASENEIKYIKEEIAADYFAENAGKNGKDVHNVEELIKTFREAITYADSLLNKRD